MAWLRRQAGQHRGQPAERVAVPRRPEADPVGGVAADISGRDQLLARVGLEGTANRKIWEISGGQQQRVAIARALAAETPLFLLDEPFAALDALTRERLQEDVRQVSAESGRTTVFVTHSADE